VLEKVVPEYLKKEEDFRENPRIVSTLDETADMAFSFGKGLCSPLRLCKRYSVPF
jgi:hypothetical protein